MSIPPLVCSTPPPLEQCEDDKDPEDFDLHYNLSQEEDDENNDFQFSSFSTYTNFNTSTKDSDKNLSISTSDQKLQEVSCDKVHNNVNEQNTGKQSNDSLNPADSDLTFDEDVLIEDLNLKFNQEPTSNNAKNSPIVSNSIIDEESIKKDLQTDIPLYSNNVSQNDYKLSSSNEENNKELTILSPTDKSEPFINEVAEELHDKINVECNEECISNINSVEKDDDDDDFEDFDEFKFTSTDNKSEIVDSADPWANEAPGDNGFGDFTANFEHGNCELPKLTNVVDESQIKNSVSETQTQLKNTNNNDNDDDDDDFGEFDEFKSSVTVNKNNEDSIATVQYQQVPVLNFQSDNENLIIESINKVLQSIFPEEITDSEDGLGNRLNATLSETWRYLRETDIRQPYMVNWNNSLAQKTLLKALCIDTRNILFGPKWTYNTPKFAANLSAAPLRPQKPITPANAPQNDQANSDKTVKTSWVDPFTADDQEFTYAEALLLDLEHLMATLDQMASNHSTLKISELLSHACNVENENTVIEAGPTDLDVFEAAMSTKTDKIFSSTLNVQPIRQINLPDTHIFTPTDSETPRSKTIHYDSNITHTILIPQTVTSTSKIKSDLPQEKSDDDLDNETEYWDFQDFRGTADKKASNVNEKLKDKNNETTVNKDTLPKPNYTIETQVLQPIRLEPIMPTLNWPNPGEVKETFDDFSDLVSKSISQNETQESELQQEASKYSNSENTNTISGNKHFEETTATGSNQLEDEFDMFQSALPSTTSISQLGFNSANSLVNQDTSSQIADFDLVFTKIDPLKSKNISLPNTRPIENTIPKSGNLTNLNELKFKTQPSSSPGNPGIQLPNTSLLQPSPATSVATQQSQQKTGQILQPLSLESYSQINWPNPGIDLQDLSRFNPVESLQSFKSDTSNHSKNASPIHNQKTLNNIQVSDEDIWGEFVSSKPKLQQTLPNKQSTFVDDDEWTDFVSSPSINTQNGLNTISLNVHTNSGMQKSSNSTKYPLKNNDIPLDIPTLNYITPKTSHQNTYNDRHFQNL